MTGKKGATLCEAFEESSLESEVFDMFDAISPVGEKFAKILLNDFSKQLLQKVNLSLRPKNQRTDFVLPPPIERIYRPNQAENAFHSELYKMLLSAVETTNLIKKLNINEKRVEKLANRLVPLVWNTARAHMEAAIADRTGPLETVTLLNPGSPIAATYKIQKMLPSPYAVSNEEMGHIQVPSHLQEVRM